MLPYCTVAQAQKIAREEGGSGSGKIWHELVLTQDEFSTIVNGGVVVRKQAAAYDSSTFSKDYYHVALDKSANLVGAIVKTGDAITKVYADFTTPAGGRADWLEKDVSGNLYEACQYAGFDHNYYKTAMLYMGMPESGAEDASYVYQGNNIVEGKNVIYVQDVTQQDWEQNPNANENEIKKVEDPRENLSREAYGGAYVLHIKGDTAEANLLFCYVTEEAAYWDSTDGEVRWTEIEAGKIYKVTFDTTHNSLRWLLQLDADGDPVEYTEEELEALAATGIAFEANKVAAQGFEDTALNIHGHVLGNDNDNLITLFSINEEFGEDYRQNFSVIGRPTARIPEYTDWYEEDESTGSGEWVSCYEGYYVWYTNIEDVYIEIIIPDEDDLRDRLLIRATSRSSGGSASIAYSSESLYRHTFNVYNASAVTIDSHSVLLNISFCAVNCQQGDSTIEYILNSDRKGNPSEPDWILPASGLIKIDSNVYTVKRIKAVYGDDEGSGDDPVLAIDYIDNTTLANGSIKVITEDNKNDFTCTDFRSVVNSFLVGESYLGK